MTNSLRILSEATSIKTPKLKGSLVNDVNAARHISLLLIAALTLLGGCQWQRSTQRQHLYSSPLLAPAQDGFGHEQLLANQQLMRERQAKRTQRARPRAKAKRASVPRATVAELSATTSPTPRSSARPSLPSLSSTRQTKDIAPPHKLAPAAAMAQANAPSQAAAYIWRYHQERGVALPEAARDQLTALYKHCKKRKAIHFKTPQPGQIVFFHNTADLNGDGRHNDWYTHAAIVSARDGDQLNLLSHHDQRDELIAMNLRHPKVDKRGKQTINTQLRARRSDDLPFTQYLSGELYAGACALAR